MGDVVAIHSIRQVCFATLALTGAGLLPAAAQAGPEVTLYLTLPLGGASTAHVFGLRLDRSSTPPDVRVANPGSPLNRRALVDLQLGETTGLRLELDRRLTWDFDRQELRQSSRPASFTLRLPVHNPLLGAVSPVHEGAVSAAVAAAGNSVRKSLAIEP